MLIHGGGPFRKTVGNVADNNGEMPTAGSEKLSRLTGFRKRISIIAVGVCILSFFYPLFLRRIIVPYDYVNQDHQRLLALVNLVVIGSLLVAIIAMFIEDVIQSNSKR
jgi:hypothetical protein